jgi:kynurenine formamidase
MTRLLDRGVRCVGTDAPSMGSANDGGPVHVAALSTGTVFVEALRGLDRLPSRGAYSLFAPLNMTRGSGAPGRALAWVPAEGTGAG